MMKSDEFRKLEAFNDLEHKLMGMMLGVLKNVSDPCEFLNALSQVNHQRMSRFVWGEMAELVFRDAAHPRPHWEILKLRVSMTAKEIDVFQSSTNSWAETPTKEADISAVNRLLGWFDDSPEYYRGVYLLSGPVSDRGEVPIVRGSLKNIHGWHNPEEGLKKGSCFLVMRE